MKYYFENGINIAHVQLLGKNVAALFKIIEET